MSSPFPPASSFNPPASWPPPPAGWVPDASWRPDPAWPAAPDGWPFYLDPAGRPAATPPGAWTPPFTPPAASPAGAPTQLEGWDKPASPPAWASGQASGPAGWSQPPGAASAPGGWSGPATTSYPPAGTGYPTPPQPAAKRGKGCLIAAAVALVLVVIAGVGGWFGLRGLMDQASVPQPEISPARIADIYDPPLNNLENIGTPSAPMDIFSEMSGSQQSCETQLAAAFLPGEQGQFIKEPGSSSEYDGIVVLYSDVFLAQGSFEALKLMISQCDPDKSPQVSAGVSVRGGWQTYSGNLAFDVQNAVLLQYGNAVTLVLTDSPVNGEQMFNAYTARIDSLG